MKKQKFKIKSLLVSLAVLLGTCVNAQITFQKTFGDNAADEAFAVEQTTDGGYIIGGFTYSFGVGVGDFYLIKTDTEGDTIWTKTYGGISLDEAFSIHQTFDGGYIMAGRTVSFGLGSIYLVKTHANGSIMWSRTYGNFAAGSYGYSVRQTTDTGYIVAGWTASFGAGGIDVYLVKTDVNGDMAWTRTFGGPGADRGYCVRQTNDGGYIVAGSTGSFGAGKDDVYLIKTDINGDTLWTRTYGGIDDDLAASVQQTSDGGYILSGHTRSFGAGSDDVYSIKTDSFGTLQWSKTYGGVLSDQGSSVEQTSDGGYIVGATSSTLGQQGAYLYKTDQIGDTMWTKRYGGASTDYCSSVQETTDGGYIIAGFTMSFGAAGWDVYLIKTDSSGASGCNEYSTNTIVGSPATLMGFTTTIVGSGASVGNPATIVTDPTTTDSVLCFLSTCSLTANISNVSDVSCFGSDDGSATAAPLNGTAPYRYSWSPLGGMNSTTTNLPSGTYIVTILDTNGCAASDTVVITQPGEFSVSITGDTSLCIGASSLLTVSEGASYLWSTSDTTQLISVSIAGVYSVQVVDTNSCLSSDSISVNIISSLSVSLGNDTSLCKNSPLILNAEIVAYNYLWSTGDTTASIMVNGEGDYWVVAGYECGDVSDTINIKFLDGEGVEIFVPNVFTPNNDKANDIFYVDGAVIDLAGMIFNRWGQKIYEWNSSQGGWDGRTRNGGFAGEAVYYYIIKYRSSCDADIEVTKQGFVTLLR
ncbi:MAG: gliding motility-associated C-terminal domain-containing protein [Bacteroidetes bacterium]|nr:gliding motility-associated C-terminal domain-containing protein [Bacteroidota bacterium]